MKYLYLLLASASLVLFQNCSKTKQVFSPMGQQGEVVAADISDADVGADVDLPQNDTLDDDIYDDADIGETRGNSGGNGGGRDDDVSTEDSNSLTEYICIVAGPGRSLKLAFDNEVLVAQNEIPKVICTTQSGCLDIASRNFDISSAEKRGFCKENGNPNVVHFSESELNALINGGN